MGHFKAWADKSGIPFRVIKPHLDETMSKARELWPKALKTLPMDEAHKEQLRLHWSKLQSDFKINI